MRTVELQTQCNLSEAGLDFARLDLGLAMFHEMTLYCGRSNALAAARLQAVHGFQLVVVPDALLHTPETWGATAHGALAWTKGC